MNLTKNELCFIDDCLTMFREPDQEEEQPRMIYRTLVPSAGTAAPPEFITKVGSALVELHERQSLGVVAQLEFTEEELWLIREIAHSNARYNDEPVGYNLKIKVHKALRELFGDSVIGDMPTALVDDPSYDKTQFEVYEYLESDDV